MNKALPFIFGFGLGVLTLYLVRPSPVIIKEPMKINPIKIPSRDMRAQYNNLKTSMEIYEAWGPDQQTTYRNQYQLDPAFIKEAYDCVQKINKLDK